MFDVAMLFLFGNRSLSALILNCLAVLSFHSHPSMHYCGGMPHTLRSGQGCYAERILLKGYADGVFSKSYTRRELKRIGHDFEVFKQDVSIYQTCTGIDFKCSPSYKRSPRGTHSGWIFSNNIDVSTSASQASTVYDFKLSPRALNFG